ncbi:probable LRR receptor-like serine/threonine-protein kinase At3g47570 [Quercus suber]|uniref:probable LRR receptor-like serine/threonine-protein kinase At3g47570 n=1 Tax=Quercus suber TaxID=58331 RepID=UPI0032DE9A58
MARDYLWSPTLEGHNVGPEISETGRLQVLRLQNNTINGKIPISLASCTNLNFLQVGYNLLTGEIPSNLGTLSKLRFFAIPQNNVTGSIPNSFGNMSSLEVFSAFFNQLGRSIPDSFGQLTKLTVFNMGSNKLSGTIPPSFFNLSSMVDFNVGGNRIQGHLPLDIGITLPNIHFFSIIENQFTGSIPASITNASNLYLLQLSNNKLHGNVPSLEKLNRMNHFRISNDNLGNGGENDLGFLCSLTNDTYPTSLHINGNNFGGELPKTIYQLCGGIHEFQLPKCNYEKFKKWKLTFTLKLIISIFFPLVGVTFVLSLLILCFLRKKRKDNTLSDSGNLLLNLSYQSLLNATNGFSSTNLIGVGSFGFVYKGILHQGRQTDIVAIKVLNLLHHGASKSFIAKCEALRNIRHRNLVKVLTSCFGIDYQGHDFKALVYEFMENGNLDEWLHPTSRMDEAVEEPKNLSLLQRLNIAIDVANALDYLHHHCQTPIVHCDLKPSNILLDDKMIGHVGDFGLTKFLFDVIEDYSIDPSSSVGVRGTVGYTPPEIFTGQRPVAKIFQDSLNLYDFVKAALPEQIIDIINPILLLEREEGEAKMIDITHNEGQKGSSKIQECLIVILGIGVACSAEFPRKRMNMSDVVIELQSTRQKLLGTKASSHSGSQEIGLHLITLDVEVSLNDIRLLSIVNKDDDLL